MEIKNLNLQEIHEKSQILWQKSDNTFLASPAYYNMVEIQLRSLLKDWNPIAKIVDFGCGNGRFTFILSEFCDEIIGYDISPQLISQACKQAKDSGAPYLKIRFANADLLHYKPYSQYDLVSCMGMTSTVISENSYLNFLTTLFNTLKLNGLLLMRDSLQKGSVHEVVHTNHYSAIYRSQQEYQSMLESFGLKCIAVITLDESENRINQLMLYKKSSVC